MILPPSSQTLIQQTSRIAQLLVSQTYIAPRTAKLPAGTTFNTVHGASSTTSRNDASVLNTDARIRNDWHGGISDTEDLCQREELTVNFLVPNALDEVSVCAK